MGEPVNESLEALQRLSAELESGDIVFPTSIDVSLRIRQALENPDININEVSRPGQRRTGAQCQGDPPCQFGCLQPKRQ
jgi:hypothetical protein